MHEQFDARVTVLDDGIAVLKVFGPADLYTSRELKELVAQAMREGDGRLAIDLSAATFVDSSGLAVLLAARRNAERLDGRAVVVNVDRDIAYTLSVTGIDGVMPVEASLDAALELLRSD